MTIAFESIYDDVRGWAEDHHVRVTERTMPRNRAGEFDGLAVVLNSIYEPEERLYYLIHAIGSIVRWSFNKSDVLAMFDELDVAKKNKQADSKRLDQALDRYRGFESESSAFAMWLFAQLGHFDAIPPYTNFMRADLESMTEFHRNGQAPVWRDFFARWNEDVACGRRKVTPFHSKTIPPFRPVQIEKQEVLQQQG
jgi:hypothetical protein